MKLKLLILEDDELTLEYYKKGLDPFFKITYCKKTSQLWEAISINEYDCFLIDIALKEESNGLMIIKALRKDAKYKEIPVVVLSAFVRKKDQDAAYGAGADIFLRKPISSKQLIIELNSAMDRKTKKKSSFFMSSSNI